MFPAGRPGFWSCRLQGPPWRPSLSCGSPWGVGDRAHSVHWGSQQVFLLTPVCDPDRQVTCTDTVPPATRHSQAAAGWMILMLLLCPGWGLCPVLEGRESGGRGRVRGSERSLGW